MSKLKLLDKIIVFLSLVLVVTIGTLIVKASSNREYIQITKHIYIEEGIDKNKADIVQQYIDILPECIKQYFTGNEIGKVYVVSSLDGDVKGHCEYDTKEIWIVADYEFDCLLHEFAHIYLHQKGVSADFVDIYNEEAKSMIEAYWGTSSEYHYSNPEEFYCTAWNIVFTMQGTDKLDVAPKTFAYFSDLFDELYS